MGRSLVVLRGAGDLGTGVAHRLHQAEYRVVILELPRPLVIRRAVAFASAIYDGEITIEGVRGVCVLDAGAALEALRQEAIPVLADPDGHSLAELAPSAIVDARMAKRNLGTRITDAPVVVGLGPGFEAGRDVHAVIETQRGHSLGRVIWAGAAAPDTGIPGIVGGQDALRVVRAPASGRFRAASRIGSMVAEGDTIGHVGAAPVTARVGGVLRGIIHDGLVVTKDLKIADVDPRGIVEHCFTISDKARSIGGGVLEALLHAGVLL